MVIDSGLLHNQINLCCCNYNYRFLAAITRLQLQLRRSYYYSAPAYWCSCLWKLRRLVDYSLEFADLMWKRIWCKHRFIFFVVKYSVTWFWLVFICDIKIQTVDRHVFVFIALLSRLSVNCLLYGISWCHRFRLICDLLSLWTLLRCTLWPHNQLFHVQGWNPLVTIPSPVDWIFDIFPCDEVKVHLLRIQTGYFPV